MKNLIYISILLLVVVACKTDKKESEIIENSKDVIIEDKAFSFEENLLDLREINKEFIEGYKVKKFGMQKIKDSIYGFVFMLDDYTNDEIVNTYSIGIRGFDKSLEKPFLTSFAPTIKVVENKKYLVLRRNLNSIRFFDSIDVYIYERKNWKNSGRLGGFKIRDILFE